MFQWVYLFIPKYGADSAIIFNMRVLLDSLSMTLQSNIRLNIIPVDYEVLITKIAARIPGDMGKPDKVVIGTLDTLP